MCRAYAGADQGNLIRRNQNVQRRQGQPKANQNREVFMQMSLAIFGGGGGSGQTNLTLLDPRLHGICMYELKSAIGPLCNLHTVTPTLGDVKQISW